MGFWVLQRGHGDERTNEKPDTSRPKKGKKRIEIKIRNADWTNRGRTRRCLPGRRMERERERGKEKEKEKEKENVIEFKKMPLNGDSMRPRPFSSLFFFYFLPLGVP